MNDEEIEESATLEDETGDSEPERRREEEDERPVWSPIAPHAWWGTEAGRLALRTLDTWGQTLHLRERTGDASALPGPLVYSATGSDRGSPSDPATALALLVDAERAIKEVATGETREFLYAVHGPGTEFREEVARVRFFFEDGTETEWRSPEWEEGEGSTLVRPPNAVKAEAVRSLERVDRFDPEGYRGRGAMELVRAIGLRPRGVFAMAHRLAAKRISGVLGY